MKKILAIILTFAFCAVMAFSLVSCKDKNDDDGDEKSSESDNSDNKPSENATHTHSANWPIEENRIEASCTENGSYDEVVYCKLCDYEFSREHVTVTATGHNYTGRICENCGYEALFSVGLEFTSNGDGTCCVSGIGNCTEIDLVIPSTHEGMTVTAVGDNAFKYSSKNYFIESVALPSTIKSIGNYAFYNCENLKSVTVPAGVTSIGSYAFYGCTNLTGIALPEDIDIINEYTFSKCYNLKEITIPESVSSIGEYAFSSCSDLTSIVIPNSITSLSTCVFSGCSSLVSVKIPDSVESIGVEAFSSCSSLTHIVIPSSVTSIEAEAFSGCGSLYKIVNNSNLVFTFKEDGHGCIAKYAKIIVDKKKPEPEYNKAFGVGYIETNDGFLFEQRNGEYTLMAYLGEYSTVTLPASIEGEGYSIYDMRGVVNVIIPDTIETIGDSAFRCCYSLKSIVLSNGVKLIDENAFKDCDNLTSIKFPSSVTQICRDAFYGCDNLKTLEIVNTGLKIESDAFVFCRKIAEVYYAGTEEEWAITIASCGSAPFYSATIHYNYISE